MGEKSSKLVRKEHVEDEKARHNVDLHVQDRNSNPSDINFGTVSETVGSAAKTSLKLLLIGKTGHGKSATGNSILRRKEFKVSSNFKSIIKEVEDAFAEDNLYNIQVVDGPGLMNADLAWAEEKQKAIENMAKTLSMCNGGVHAFILVIKFKNKFTKEEKTAISHLEEIYGPSYLKEHGIIVVTGGDDFPRVMEEEETPNKSFRDWCQEQDEDLFKKCHRIILFDNVTKNEEENECQRNELLQLAVKISKEKGLYTTEHFKMYADIREEIIKEHNVPLLKETIQRNISLLVAELGSISEKVSLADLDRLEIRIHALNKEMQDLDQSENYVKQIIDDLRAMQNTIDKIKTAIKEENEGDIRLYVKDLQKQRKKLKRTKEIPWELIALIVGAVIIAGCLTLTGVGASVVLPILVIEIKVILISIGTSSFIFGIPFIKQCIEKWKNRNRLK